MMRYPLTDLSLPAVKAVLGAKGIVEGRDYRKKNVLAAIKAVPDSTWFLVAKVDKEEIYAPLTARFWVTVFFILGAHIDSGSHCCLYLALSAGEILP